MNALANYFEKQDDTPSALARKLNRPVSTITRIARGERRPSIRLAREIERVTGIPYQALRPDLFPEAAQGEAVSQ